MNSCELGAGEVRIRDGDEQQIASTNICAVDLKKQIKVAKKKKLGMGKKTKKKKRSFGIENKASANGRPYAAAVRMYRLYYVL